MIEQPHDGIVVPLQPSTFQFDELAGARNRRLSKRAIR